MLREELRLHLSDLILESRKAKDWEQHVRAEAQASILEEMLDLSSVMLNEELRAIKEKEV